MIKVTKDGKFIWSTGRASKATRNKINRSLYELSKKYWPSIPTEEIGNVLKENGISPEEALEGIYCGREGRMNEMIYGSAGYLYLILSWYKMESGRYEINTFVS